MTEDSGRTDLELAHEVNLSLLETIGQKQTRKFQLSLVSLAVMLLSVGGLLAMAVTNVSMNDSVKELLIILLTAAATGQSKLFDFWFNNTSSDNDLLERATSYNMNGPPRS